MGRTAGTPNKITAVIREKLSNLIDSTVDLKNDKDLDYFVLMLKQKYDSLA